MMTSSQRRRKAAKDAATASSANGSEIRGTRHQGSPLAALEAIVSSNLPDTGRRLTQQELAREQAQLIHTAWYLLCGRKSELAGQGAEAAAVARDTSEGLLAVMAPVVASKFAALESAKQNTLLEESKYWKLRAVNTTLEKQVGERGRRVESVSRQINQADAVLKKLQAEVDKVSKHPKAAVRRVRPSARQRPPCLAPPQSRLRALR